ncbi:chemotaxis protein CheB [Occallatibacter riparius]|uniref:protein-glutamate methylesterase n=1 Tax=Occallatibacter riparius TaxID=1002689 RepID=A0A9J7BVP5_9BACT|nr:chemotaxis protein CheB [Occallatibacter riparius]UWZ86940.1 chemotaxis protein CheB [Occallatibacter riparius]
MAARDIIVVGASAGGFEALQTLAAGLPADLKAAVFVTLHQSPHGEGILPLILNRAGALPTLHAEDGMLIEEGRIYVAPPDHHLMIRNGFLELGHGPKENLHRPCINVMFRSAAAAYRERVAGVVLTGLLDDGAAGLWEIQQHNGTTIVQDPEEAAYRSMPDSAIRGLNVQYIVRLGEIAPLLMRLAVEDEHAPVPAVPDPEPEPATQVCPECGGAMTMTRMSHLREFRCHTGHRFGLKSLIAEKITILERALTGALAQSEELTQLLRTAIQQGETEHGSDAAHTIERHLEQQDMLRHLLESGRDTSEILREA